jgi:hypothetical protein
MIPLHGRNEHTAVGIARFKPNLILPCSQLSLLRRQRVSGRGTEDAVVETKFIWIERIKRRCDYICAIQMLQILRPVLLLGNWRRLDTVFWNTCKVARWRWLSVTAVLGGTDVARFATPRVVFRELRKHLSCGGETPGAAPCFSWKSGGDDGCH